MSTSSVSGYLDYAGLTSRLAVLADTYTDILRLDSLGKSHECRDIPLVILTRFATGDHNDKPALWIDANIHSAELVSSAAAMHFIEWMISNRERDDIARCLDSRTIYICPRLNPDGAELALAPVPRLLRSSVRPYPYNDVLLDGFDVRDMDGDGRVLSMRIPDPNGPWKVCEQEPRLLVRREPTETGGQYYRVLPEGQVRDYDGFNLPAVSRLENLDLNRNFPVQWRPEHEQKGAGDYPASEPEVQAAVAFITSHANIFAGIALHSYSGVVLRPYSFQSDEHMPAEDVRVFQAMGKQAESMTGYPAASAFEVFRYHPQEVITGAMDDWMYDALGRFGWTVELWSPQRAAGIEKYDYIDWYREHPIEDDLKLLRWNDTQLDGKGFIDWYPYEHPQLGEVELGGWNALYSFWNPPETLLEKEVARLPEWLLWHTLVSPRLEWLNCSAKPMPGGLYRVEASVINTGWLPTNITQRALKQSLRGLRFSLDLPDTVRLEQGKRVVEVGQLTGRADKPVVPGVGLVNHADPTDDRVRVSWIIAAQHGDCISITASHDRAGTLHKELVLE